MKIDATKLALATASVFAVLWIACSALVAVLPAPMMQMSGHMMHAELGHMTWNLRWGGFFTGLILWSGVSALTVWMIATFYNRMLD